MMLLLLTQLVLLLEFCVCFNVDTRAPVVHSGELGTEFGFSVELHRERGINWLLVGAPRAETDQQGVNEGGAVYRCPVSPVDSPGPCTQIAFDTTGDPTQGATQIGSKSNQRFGYTVESSGPDGPVVACAPLRKWYTSEGRYRFPTGACFVARNNFNDIQEMTPCETSDTDDWKRLGPVYCQAGMSAAINQDALVMGGPGSIYWQGSLYVDIFNTNLDPLPFRDTASLDDSYRGYSVTFGEFNGDDSPDVAAGLPRAPDHKGEVRLYTTLALTPIKTLHGEQVGCYFGHSIAAIDLNGDNLDDLIIGAPMYIDEDRSLEGWEAGRVYIYFQDPDANGNFLDSPTEVISGKTKRGRFGFSVAGIGDMDKDGYNDFAIGAPFDGKDGAGAVYIFHGRRRGLLTTPAQIVHPIDLGLGITTFGYSLASGLDMDNNQYIDLLVGAYNSSTAVLLRSRPVVMVDVVISTKPKAVDWDAKDKRLPDGTMVAAFNITAHVSYRGNDVPDLLDVAFTITLDSQRPLASRAAFTSNNDYRLSYQVTLQQNMARRISEEAYVRNNIRDRKSPIGILIEYSLPFDENNMQPGEIAPILNQNMDSFAYQSVPLLNECKNFHCLPDLQLTASTTTTELIIGADEPMYLEISVSNDGEDAFEAVFAATFPEGLQFVRVERKQLDVSVTCNEDVNTNQISCDLGNPFPESHQVSFDIKLDNIGLRGDAPEANITMQVRSASIELQNTTADNFANTTVDVRAETQIRLTGVSDPPIYEVPAKEDGNNDADNMQRDITKQSDAGPEITHYYILRNLGPSNIGPTTVEILWPMWYSKDEYLLYLVSARMESGSNEKCEIYGGIVNPEGLITPKPELKRNNGSDTETGGAAALQGNAAAGRKKRQAEEQFQYINPYVDFNCEEYPERCYNITCRTGGLMAGSDQLDSVNIIIRSRLWLDTVNNIESLRELKITSSAKATVQSMPYAIAPAQLPNADAEVASLIVPEILEPTPPKAIPLWVYVVATMVGVFILCVIVLGLWKIGFFKRKKIQPNNPRAMVSDDNWVEDALQKPTDE